MRKRIKRWVFGSLPFMAGAFNYFGTKVYFPKGSCAFRAACDQGVFESDNLRVLCSQLADDSIVFDIGCNLGLMAVPLLARFGNLQVVSFEPSPNSLPYLRKTIESSAFASRWKLVEKAVGDSVGKAKFHLAESQESFYDGLQDTDRVKMQRTVEVDVTTVDQEWLSLKRPAVALIKCDIEGGELNMLKGAKTCINTCRPAIVLEWNRDNLRAYGIKESELISVARELSYEIFAVPSLNQVSGVGNLLASMAFTESFLLLPNT